jgi:THO complex subunit 4
MISADTTVIPQEYFEKTIGPIKRVILNYGPNGASRGVANVIFAQADAASKAVTQLNGLKVDGRPMKVDSPLHV